MKKTVCCIIFALIFVSVFTLTASAEETDFWEEFKEILPDGKEYNEESDVLSSVGLPALLSEILSAFSSSKGAVISFLSLVMGVVLIISVSECFGLWASDSLKKESEIGVVIVSALIIFGAVKPVIFSVKEGIEEMGKFLSSLIPILSGISLAGGNAGTAGVQALNMNITCSAIGYVSSSLLLPLSFMMFALALADGMGKGKSYVIARGVRNSFLWIMGICSTLLVAAFSLQSLIASASDGAYLRTAKYAISGSIPLVGGTVSSALGALIGGLSYAKSAIGAASVGIIVAMALSVLVMLLLYRAVISLGATVLEFVGAPLGVRTFSAFKSAFDALIAVYVMTTLVCIFEIVIFIKSGVEVFG